MTSTAIGKGLRTLDLLASEAGGVGVADVASRLGISKPAAGRVLDALVAAGYARVDASTQRHVLTMKATRLGLSYFSRSGITAGCQPILDRLSEATGELVRMAVVDGDRLIWFGLAQGARTGLRIAPDTGREVTLHVTAAGKAWLATLPLERAVKLVLDRGFGEADQFGPQAIRSVEGLIAALKATARNGYAVSIDEYIPGMSALAVAIAAPGFKKGTLGTLSIACPTSRMTRPQHRRLQGLLEEAAAELSTLWPILAARTAF